MRLNIHNIVSPKGYVWKLDNRYSILLACMLWVLIVQILIPEGFNYGEAAPTSGTVLSSLIWMSLLGLSGFIIVSRISLAWLLVRSLNPFLLLFVALAVMSFAWSIDGQLTLRRLVRLITIVLVCFAFVLSGWHARRFQNVVRPVLTLLLFGSIVFVLVSPDLAIHQELEPELLGAWRGLAPHKNGLGALACFGVIFWYHAWLNREVKLKYALIGGIIAAICLVKSRSATSLVTALVVMMIMTLLLRAPLSLRPYRALLISVAAIVLLVYALAVLKIIPGMSILLEPIMALTGKDFTFTGRNEIWAIVSAHIDLRPFFGSGYGAYWTPQPVPGHDSYVFLSRLQGFYPGSCHNGYLEVINDLGWVGLIFLLGFFFFYIRQSIQLMAIDAGQATLYIGLFFQQAITNLSESHWFFVLGIDIVIMTVAALGLGRSLLQYQLRGVFG